MSTQNSVLSNEMNSEPNNREDFRQANELLVSSPVSQQH